MQNGDISVFDYLETKHQSVAMGVNEYEVIGSVSNFKNNAYLTIQTRLLLLLQHINKGIFNKTNITKVIPVYKTCDTNIFTNYKRECLFVSTILKPFYKGYDIIGYINLFIHIKQPVLIYICLDQWLF